MEKRVTVSPYLDYHFVDDSPRTHVRMPSKLRQAAANVSGAIMAGTCLAAAFVAGVAFLRWLVSP